MIKQMITDSQQEQAALLQKHKDEPNVDAEVDALVEDVLEGKIRKNFARGDKDKSGSINLEEGTPFLKDLMKVETKTPQEEADFDEQAKSMLGMLDSSKNNEVEVEEALA